MKYLGAGLNVGTTKITSVAAGTVSTDAVNFSQLGSAKATYAYLKTSGGTVNTAITSAITAGTLVVGDTIVTSAYYQGGQYGGNVYRVVAAATGTDDAGSYVTAGGLQLQGVFGEVVSVAQFGTKIDGTTNDTTAIQAAINYATARGGGDVLFPPGTFAVAGTINGTISTTLVGCGPTATILSHTGSGACINLQVNQTNTLKRFGVQSLRVAGTSSGTAGIDAGDFYGLDLRCVVVSGYSTGVGFLIKNTNLWSEGLYVEDCHSNGNLVGLKFFRGGGTATNSFGYTKLVRLSVNCNIANSIGIDVCGDGASGVGYLYNSWLDANIWLEANNTTAIRVGTGTACSHNFYSINGETIGAPSGAVLLNSTGYIRGVGTISSDGTPVGTPGNTRLSATERPLDSATGTGADGEVFSEIATSNPDNSHVSAIGFTKKANHEGVYVTGYEGLANDPIFRVVRTSFNSSAAAGAEMFNVLPYDGIQVRDASGATMQTLTVPTGGGYGTWGPLTNTSGTTGQRPTLTAGQAGYARFNTTLGAPEWWNGSSWGSWPVKVYSWNGSAWVEDTTVNIYIRRTGDPAPTGLTANDIVLTQS